MNSIEWFSYSWTLDARDFKTKMKTFILNGYRTKYIEWKLPGNCNNRTIIVLSVISRYVLFIKTVYSIYGIEVKIQSTNTET